MPELLANLNEPQLAAVTLPRQHALILAGAGSGKTRVLTTRIAWLISTGQVSPQGILAVTFTNKAAREMLARVSALLPINLRGMWIGTFHGLCNRMLRAHFRDAALPQAFQILDSSDQLASIKRLLKAANVDDEKFPPRQLQWFISDAKEQGLRPDAVEPANDYDRRMVELYRLYDEQCQREGVVDFSELLLRSYELLSRNQLLREHYQRRFVHVLVDEFQDTNALQYRWLKLLAGPDSAVFAVGDDDQSIYAFRGANVGNMAAFERELQVRNLIKLEQNYRSAGHILDCANTLIRQNRNRLGKELWTDAGVGEPVRVFEAMTDSQEAQWLVEQSKALIREGASSRDLAVLYRSNAQSRVLEHALFAANIPYRVYGGLRFFERAEVKHALAYLRLIHNPHDDTSFLRVVNFPARGIGARSLEMLGDQARTQGSSLYAVVGRVGGAAAVKFKNFVDLIESLQHESHRLSLPQLIEHTIERSGLIAHYQTEKEGQDRIENLQELINAAGAYLSDAAVAQDTPANVGVSDAARRSPPPGPSVIDAPSFMNETAPLDSAPWLDEAVWADQAAPGAEPVSSEESVHSAEPGWDQESAHGDESVRPVAVDRQAIAGDGRFDAAGAAVTVDPGEAVTDVTPLAGFLSHAALEAGDNQAADGADAMQLMTVHAAKGLEFDVVFITGLEEGLFPHENSLTESDGLEEERRLMYVALTRARQRLYLSFSQTRLLHGQTRYNMRSRFLQELPDGALKWLTPRVESASRREGWGGAWEGFERNAPPRAAAPRSPAVAANGMLLRIGQSVAHARFGEGVVVRIEGSGGDARAQINFGRDGLKWLALSVAKLEAV